MNIPANTPTAAQTMTMSAEPGDLVLDINQDGTFTSISDVNSEDPDTSYGAWIADGNNLTIIDYTIVDGEIVYSDTTYGTYNIAGNILTITSDEDICTDDEDPEECLADIEEELGIDTGSLITAVNRMTSEFQKAAAAK